MLLLLFMVLGPTFFCLIFLAFNNKVRWVDFGSLTLGHNLSGWNNFGKVFYILTNL